MPPRPHHHIDEVVHTLATLSACAAAVLAFGAVFYWIPLILGAPLIAATILFAVALIVTIAILEVYGA
jgi:hypothetical protein